MGKGYEVSSLIWKTIVWRDCPNIILAIEVPVISETSLSFDSESYPLSVHCIPLKYPKTVCQEPSLTSAFLTQTKNAQAFDSVLWERKLGLSISFLERERWDFAVGWVGGAGLESPASSILTTPLNPKSPVFCLWPQAPHPQAKRLMILSVQLNIEIVTNPQLQSDPNDSSK